MSDSRQYVQLLLTCANGAEADHIAEALLERRLIVCAKQAPVSARYWGEGKLEQADETLLIMESAVDLFEAVEAEVAKRHSFDTFVLEALPLAGVSAKAQKWLAENLAQQGTVS